MLDFIPMSTIESPKPSGGVAGSSSGPTAIPSAPKIYLPESRTYRLKNRLLGKPYDTEQLQHERLGNPTAMSVFASDNLSSSAYATEEILHVLVKYIGLAAFTVLMPSTVAMIAVLFFLILSYRQTIKAYPSAGGAYVVSRDNHGIMAAQVAGVSLLTDYILTAAVSAAAGTAALISVFPELDPLHVPIAASFVCLIAFMNLRGVRESGSIFRVPTFAFIGMMGVLAVVGFGRWIFGDLPLQSELPSQGDSELIKLGTDQLLWTLPIVFIVLKGFASGGAAVTGVEAISNGVPAFKPPEWKNASKTLVWMGSLLGLMFLTLSALATHMQVLPYEGGTPTVISEIGRLVFGQSLLGQAGFIALQAGTMLILIMAANTAFADFPRLASFMADDGFAPRQMVKRGHRLVYSNGIIGLSACAIALLVFTGAEVSALIPLYAVGVFTGFTLSQSGMVRHHLRLREQGWRVGLAINGFGLFLSALVLVIITVTKFMGGAWLICVIIPVGVLILIRLNRQYAAESADLLKDAEAAASEPILRRHVVLVLINRLDKSTARAIQYGRTLMPDALRAVHIGVDPIKAKALTDQWATLPLARIPLDVVACPDRRLDRTALEYIVSEVSNGQTEVTVVLPHRVYRHFWHRFLHDRSAENLSEELSVIPHVNVTMIPFLFETRGKEAKSAAHDARQLLGRQGHHGH